MKIYYHSNQKGIELKKKEREKKKKESKKKVTSKKKYIERHQKKLECLHH